MYIYVCMYVSMSLALTWLWRHSETALCRNHGNWSVPCTQTSEHNSTAAQSAVRERAVAAVEGRRYVSYLNRRTEASGDNWRLVVWESNRGPSKRCFSWFQLPNVFILRDELLCLRRYVDSVPAISAVYFAHGHVPSKHTDWCCNVLTVGWQGTVV